MLTFENCAFLKTKVVKHFCQSKTPLLFRIKVCARVCLSLSLSVSLCLSVFLSLSQCSCLSLSVFLSFCLSASLPLCLCLCGQCVCKWHANCHRTLSCMRTLTATGTCTFCTFSLSSHPPALPSLPSFSLPPSLRSLPFSLPQVESPMEFGADISWISTGQ